MNLIAPFIVFFLCLSLTACKDGRHSSVERNLSATAPQYDEKTGVKLDTRFLQSAASQKAFHKAETEHMVVVGEVVDAWCYASQTMGAGHGPVHQACAVACVGGGVTPGILDDEGVMWICVKHKGYTGCKDVLFPFVARRVKVTGWAAHKGGCNVLKVDKVELEMAASSPVSGANSGALAPPALTKKDK